MVVPWGHMINRPPPGVKANCIFRTRKGLTYVVANKNFVKEEDWEELYVAYNDQRI